MIYGLWQSAAGMQTNLLLHDVEANNLANVDTVGFKRQMGVLTQRPAPTDERGSPRHSLASLAALGTQSWPGPTVTDFSAGTTQTSGNPLDVALVGRGFLCVRGRDGVAYTRDGRLQMARDGRLVTATGGREVLDAGGRSITLNPTAGKVRIAPDGTIRQGGDAVARLGVVDFPDLQRLRRTGGGLFDAEGQTPRPAAAQVRQYALESSGVEPTRSIVSLIEVMRAYQLNAQMIHMQDGMLGRAVNDIGRVA